MRLVSRILLSSAIVPMIPPLLWRGDLHVNYQISFTGFNDDREGKSLR